MTTYTLRQGNPATTRTDVVVVAVGRDAKGAPVVCPGGEKVASAYGRKLAPLLSSMGFHGKAGEVLRVPTGGALKAAVLVAVGVGDRAALDLDKVRRAAGVAARNLGNAASVALALPAHDGPHIRAVVEGFGSGLYTYAGHRSEPAPSRLGEVVVLSEAARKKAATQALADAELLVGLVDQTRDWVNMPPNELNPQTFADAAVALGRKRKGVKTEVLEQAELEKLGCGGILGVGRASATPPRLVRLSWKPKKAQARLALVGKGITYDSGGLNIKSGRSMTEMKFDMAGAAAVIAAVHAIAALELPVEVTGYAPMAENMLSGSALRPGDVLTMYGGRTVEVRNTDAEGRLILADALAMAAETRPDAILNIATLTGPCVVALGERIAGLFGDPGQVAAVQDAARSAGELVWPLPVTDHTREQVRTESVIADVLQHNWVRWGSSSWAAAFLWEFVGEVPFAHLDIAGPAFNTGSAYGHVPGGATGFGVPTLVEYAAQLAATAS